MITSGKGFDVNDLVGEFTKSAATDFLKDKAGDLLGGLFK